jgi:hypothetical protein
MAIARAVKGFFSCRIRDSFVTNYNDALTLSANSLTGSAERVLAGCRRIRTTPARLQSEQLEIPTEPGGSYPVTPVKADQHYRNVVRNGWASMPGELLGYACNLCAHMVNVECSATALRQERQAALARARASIRRHIREVHPHLS